jgi:hypothetical protein
MECLVSPLVLAPTLSPLLKNYWEEVWLSDLAGKYAVLPFQQTSIQPHLQEITSLESVDVWNSRERGIC